MLESGCCLTSLMVSHFVFSWAFITEILVGAFSVEPMNPFHRGALHISQTMPGTKMIDYFCFVEAVDGFSERIIERIAFTAN